MHLELGGEGWGVAGEYLTLSDRGAPLPFGLSPLLMEPAPLGIPLSGIKGSVWYRWGGFTLRFTGEGARPDSAGLRALSEQVGYELSCGCLSTHFELTQFFNGLWQGALTFRGAPF